MTERVAIIDLGTNTFHLLIAEKTGSKTHILHREKQAVKIGMGGFNKKVITPEAFLRGTSCLKNFKDTMEKWNVEKSIAIGTSALRDAANGSDFIHQVNLDTGISITLISGDQEAEYIYYGVRSAVSLGTEKSMIIDIGGGSVEFILADSKTIFWKKSFDIGAQRLMEKYQKHDPILGAEVTELNAYFTQVLMPLNDVASLHNPSTLVGSSGTFDTLSEIYCTRMGITISEDQPETPLTVDAFRQIHQELIQKSRTERLGMAGMIDMRVDMIVVASCLVDYLIRKFHFKKIRVSSYSLKEGILAQL